MRLLNQKLLRKQRGTVLITVLLIVSFVVILIAQVNKTVTYQANLNRNLMHRDQAYSYLIGMEELAKIYLKKAFDSEKGETVHLGQAWAKDDIVFPIDGGSMSARIRDMHSCFNLNSIAHVDKNDPAAGKQRSGATGSQSRETTGQIILTVLLESQLSNSEVQPSALVTAVRDWIDPDTTPSGPDGVEDLYYQGLDVPYLPPNGPIAHVSELRMIKSFDKRTYAKVRKYLCVLPNGEDNKINVNTITSESAVVLYAALGGKVSLGDINQLISSRPEKGYDMAGFWNAVGNTKKIKKNLKERLDVTSRYFQIDAKAEINRTKVYMKTLFIKQEDNSFRVVSRYFGKE